MNQDSQSSDTSFIQSTSFLVDGRTSVVRNAPFSQGESNVIPIAHALCLAMRSLTQSCIVFSFPPFYSHSTEDGVDAVAHWIRDRLQGENGIFRFQVARAIDQKFAQSLGTLGAGTLESSSSDFWSRIFRTVCLKTRHYPPETRRECILLIDPGLPDIAFWMEWNSRSGEWRSKAERWFWRKGWRGIVFAGEKSHPDHILQTPMNMHFFATLEAVVDDDA